MSQSDEEPMDQVVVVPFPSATTPSAPSADAPPAPAGPPAPVPAATVPVAQPQPQHPAVPITDYTGIQPSPAVAVDPNSSLLAHPCPTAPQAPSAGFPTTLAAPPVASTPQTPPVAVPSAVPHAQVHPSAPPASMAPLVMPQAQPLPGIAQAGGVAMIFTSSPLHPHPRPNAPWGPPAAGTPFGNLCTSCQIRPPNPGRSWCQGCFLRGQGKAVCTNCDSAPPPAGKTLCTPCWRAANNMRPAAPAAPAAPAGLPLCTSCNTTPANTGYSWCQGCYTINRAHPIPPHLACAKCNKKHKNPGYSFCQGCYLESKGLPVCVNCKNAAPCYRSTLCSTCTSTRHGAYRALPSTPCLNCYEQLPNRKPICGSCTFLKSASKKSFFINIPHSDPRFLDIQNQFFSKGFAHIASRIVSVMAVYNPKAYTGYQAYKQSLVAQRGGDSKAAVNERRMFKAYQPSCNLGSSGRYCHNKTCNPCHIVKAGFAMNRDAEHGMYGNGIYFSFNPTDAHRALHTTGGSGCSVMMMSKVAVGQVDKAITPRPNAKGSGRGCNSILGKVAGGPECIVVHANAAALPAYLIVYQH